ncbi:hypothetical protein SAMN05216359_107115 [Roseateles sp. YR242]|uniref:hypothetical protein n=1 Tax=Roseateles sp. YR242 TaxID=1855305 RepID=UPI0008C62EEF|nr:hypothetical protein [Roseateles sp. YR242]SEL29371.1 hypothetical protein SAMN05216359_107115 [Roseateles sp. YR242]
MLEERYEKSEAGRAEIKKRALVQARIARNLLLVIDPSKTGGQWVGVVQGAAPADLELLLQHGLISSVAAAALSRPAPLGPEPASSPAPAPASVAAPAAPAAPAVGGPPSTRSVPVSSTRPMGAPVSQLDFQQLYTALTVFAKQQGLLKGYRMALEVEQCQDFEQLQTLALDVVDRVRATKGDAAAHALRETLGFN